MKKLLLASMAMIFTADVAMAQVLSITQQRHPGTGQYRINFYSDYGADGVRGGGDDTVRSYTAPNLGLANAHSFSRVLSDAIDFYVGPSVDYRFEDTGTGTAAALTAAQNALNHHLTEHTHLRQGLYKFRATSAGSGNQVTIYIKILSNGSSDYAGQALVAGTTDSQYTDMGRLDYRFSFTETNSARATRLTNFLRDSGNFEHFATRVRDSIEPSVTLTPDVAFTTPEPGAFNGGQPATRFSDSYNFVTNVYYFVKQSGSGERYYALRARGSELEVVAGGVANSLDRWVPQLQGSSGFPFLVIDNRLPAGQSVTVANLRDHVSYHAHQSRRVGFDGQPTGRVGEAHYDFQHRNRATTPTAEGYTFDRYRIGDRDHDSLTEWGITTGPNAINIGDTLTAAKLWKIDAALEEAYHDGYIDGYQQGYEHGFGDGYETGFSLGRETD